MQFKQGPSCLLVAIKLRKSIKHPWNIEDLGSIPCTVTYILLSQWSSPPQWSSSLVFYGIRIFTVQLRHICIPCHWKKLFHLFKCEYFLPLSIFTAVDELHWGDEIHWPTSRGFVWLCLGPLSLGTQAPFSFSDVYWS